MSVLIWLWAFIKVDHDKVYSLSQLRVDIEVQRGVAYHVIVKYYKPYHYTNFQETVTATVVWVLGSSPSLHLIGGERSIFDLKLINACINMERRSYLSFIRILKFIITSLLCCLLILTLQYGTRQAVWGGPVCSMSMGRRMQGSCRQWQSETQTICGSKQICVTHSKSW